MTPSAPQAITETRLPQLSGSWVLAYRLVWAAMAMLAVAVLVASFYRADAAPAVLALRVVKAGILISVCAVLLRRRKDDPVAALLSLAFLTWTITSSFDFASSAVLPMLADRLRFLLFAVALLLFPDGRWHPVWTRHVAVASVTVFLLGIVEGIGWTTSHLFLPLAILCVLAAVTALIIRFRTARMEAERQQLKWVALGLVSGISMILAARAGAQFEQSSPPLVAPIFWEALFQLGIIVLALGFLVSLIRYRLFDAEAAISRSAALAVLTLALVATFAGTEASIEWVGQQYFGMGIGNVSAAMAAAVAAVLLNPLHDRISGWAEYHFQRDLVALKRELPELLEDLTGTASAKELATSALSRICEAVHATRGAIVVENAVIAWHGIDDDLASRNQALPDHSTGNPFPMQLPMHGVEQSSPASLLLGSRPDGTLYGKDDIDALREVAPVLRRALFVTLRNDQYRCEVGALNRHLEELRDRLRALEAIREADLVSNQFEERQ